MGNAEKRTHFNRSMASTGTFVWTGLRSGRKKGVRNVVMATRPLVLRNTACKLHGERRIQSWLQNPPKRIRRMDMQPRTATFESSTPHRRGLRRIVSSNANTTGLHFRESLLPNKHRTCGNRSWSVGQQREARHPDSRTERLSNYVQQIMKRVKLQTHKRKTFKTWCRKANPSPQTEDYAMPAAARTLSFK